MTFFLVWFLGFVCGFFSVVVYALYLLRKYDKKRLAFAADLAQATKNLREKTESVKERINKAFDICELQFDIMAKMEGPQSGPLHGRHKNQMNAELKRLEEEKMTLLKSVLADGHDPKLVTINERGEKESIKLSDFVARRDLEDTSKQEPITPEPPKKKLSLVKNTDKE